MLKMKIYHKYLLLLLPLLAFTSKSDSSKLIADKRISTVTYAMNHPMHSWEGVCKDVNSVIVYDKATKTIQQ